MENLQGRKIKGRYRVDALIGRGGMAEVYKVWDEERADSLAMKVLREDLAQDKVFLRRFEREAQTLAKLQHRSIVRFYGLEQDDLLVFLLMEYIEGTSLREEIFRAKKPFTNQRILEVLRPVCAAMHYAHRMGIVHCDLKPGNILINQHGELLVTDFGIARMIDASTATMVGLGTPAYMAPELVKGQDPLPQTDIYALGVILYEMLTGGERPFTGERAETTGSTAEKIRWEQMKLAPKPLTDYNPDLSPEIQEVVLRCLAKIPDQRYEDIQKIYEETGAFLNTKSEIINQVERKAEPVKEKVYEFHDVEKEEVNENLQTPKQSIEKAKEKPLLVKKNNVPLFTHLYTQEGNIYDFDLYANKAVVSAEGEIVIRDVKKGDILQSCKELKNYGQIYFHSGDESIIFKSSDNIDILNIKDKRIIRELSNDLMSPINRFSVEQNVNYCVVVNEAGEIIVWNIKTGKFLESYKGLFDPTWDVIISPWRYVIKISATGYIHSLSLPELKIMNCVQDGNLLSYSEKKRIVCTNSGKLLAIWKNEFDAYLAIYQSYNSLITKKKFSSRISAAMFTPDENRLLVIEEGGEASFLDVRELNAQKQFSLGINNIDKALFSDNGQYLVTLCKGERLDCWKVKGQGDFS